MSLFRWFEAQDAFVAYANALRPVLEPLEAALAAREVYDGFCTRCMQPTRFTVSAGVMLGHGPNLREGLLCARCGLSNRGRLLFTALRETVPAAARIAALERLSPLYAHLADAYPGLQGSEFVAADMPSGTRTMAGATEVRHESITALSYATGALDALCHSDVLEHVFATDDALRECRRVLRDGGSMVFTCPFLMHLAQTSPRALQRDDGTIELLAPAEYHGDPIHPAGALTFHHFGWDLLARCRAAGFARAACGVRYDAYLGFTSSHHPDWNYGAMLPLVFRLDA